MLTCSRVHSFTFDFILEVIYKVVNWKYIFNTIILLVIVVIRIVTSVSQPEVNDLLQENVLLYKHDFWHYEM